MNTQLVSRLPEHLPKHHLPKHIAIIMDGNNRFAKAHAMPAGQGHVAGKDALDPIVRQCLALGIDVLTVFAFSSENWQRPANEVALLMRLLEESIHEQIPKMNEHQVRLRFIGDRSQLSDKLQVLMANAEAQTAHFTAMTLVIAVSYGGQWDIAQAAKQLASQVVQGNISLQSINVDSMSEHLALADAPAVDMLIRTGGEYRLSNFLLWQMAYAELFFTETLWPQFSPTELEQMLVEFASRQRRFGRTSEQVIAGNLVNLAHQRSS